MWFPIIFINNSLNVDIDTYLPFARSLTYNYDLFRNLVLIPIITEKPISRMYEVMKRATTLNIMKCDLTFENFSRSTKNRLAIHQWVTTRTLRIPELEASKVCKVLTYTMIYRVWVRKIHKISEPEHMWDVAVPSITIQSLAEQSCMCDIFSCIISVSTVC